MPAHSSKIDTNSSKKVLILANPLAGRGLAKQLLRRAEQFCRQSQWEIIGSHFSEYAGHIEKTLVTDFASSADLIILIGGDGTLRELVAGLYREKFTTEIAFIPLGNANVVARELSIPLDPERALCILNNSEIKKVDIGILEQEQLDAHLAQHIFLAMLEIGIGAKIVHIVNQLRLGRLKRLYQFWGDIVYALAGFLAFLQLKASPTQVKTKTSQSSSTHIVISNMQTYAKGWAISPNANCTDGKLDIAMDQKGSRLSYISTFLLAARRKASTSSRMRYARSKAFELTGSEQVFMQVDGDPIKFEGKACVRIEPQAFSIHVPKQHSKI